jgi:hypothetical protein
MASETIRHRCGSDVAERMSRNVVAGKRIELRIR